MRRPAAFSDLNRSMQRPGRCRSRRRRRSSEVGGAKKTEKRERRGKRNDPSSLFIRRGAGVRRANPGVADFGGKAVASIVVGLLNKGDINAQVAVDVIPVYEKQRA